MEILRSNERPGLTPVFGSTVPPSGLSGMMRRAAFKFSENDLRHWLICWPPTVSMSGKA